MKTTLNTNELVMGMVVYAYRNLPIIEDNHSDTDFYMNKDYYEKVYIEVNQKLTCLLSNIDFVLMLIKEGFTEKIMYFSDNIKNMVGTVFLYGINAALSWNSPVLLDEPIDDDYAEYLLRGEFLKHCENHANMNDKDMKEINIDITNRMYSLLHNKGLL